MFAYADPGHDTATELRTWAVSTGNSGRGSRIGAEGRVAAVRTDSEFDRAEKVLNNWTNPKRSPSRSKASATGRKIERIEQGIRGRDKREIGEHGRLRGCLARLAEFRRRPRSYPRKR